MNERKSIEWLFSQLPMLEENGILSSECARNIRLHYENYSSGNDSRNLAVQAFSILGGLLVGAGIILLIAHNWDDLGKGVRTILSIAPLVLAAVVSGWVVLRKMSSPAWREGAGIFHVLSVGASISLISQTYNIYGDFFDFMFTWSLLSLPLIYLLQSGSVTILYLIGITTMECADYPSGTYWYWPMLAAALPYYFAKIHHDRRSRTTGWLSVLLCASVTIALIAESSGINKNVPWFLPLSGFYTLIYLSDRKWLGLNPRGMFTSPIRIIGAGGITVLSILLTWRTFDMLGVHSGGTHGESQIAYFIFEYGFVIASLLLAVSCFRTKTDFNIAASGLPIVAAAVCIDFGNIWIDKDPRLMILTNGYAALLSIVTIVRGFRYERIGTLNAGMGIAVVLIAVRFFDSEISFIIRGVTFIIMGVGFLAANWMLLKKKRHQPS